MIRPDAGLRVYLCREPVDMRKWLGTCWFRRLWNSTPSRRQYSYSVFGNRQRDKVKILFWERNGFVVWYKRLEKKRFKWPSRLDGDTLSLSGQELNWLLDGYDITLMIPHKLLNYQLVG